MSEMPQSSEDALWNHPETHTFTQEQKHYVDVVLEQYKLYVETTNHISDRRMHANNFFLTLHSGIAAGIGFILINQANYVGPIIAALAALGGGALAVVWIFLLRSYRDLNTAKFGVVGLLEKRLPASPLWRCEWTKLGEGKDRSKYWPLSHIEFSVPAIVLVLYALLFAVSVFMSTTGTGAKISQHASTLPATKSVP